MTESKYTSISVLKETKKVLETVKQHPRETCDDVIRTLLAKAGHEIPEVKDGE